MQNSEFLNALDGATKEEKKFLVEITKLLNASPYSLRVVVLLDARDDTRTDFAGIITGCCRSCAYDLVMNAANAMVDNDEFDVVIDAEAVVVVQ